MGGDQQIINRDLPLQRRYLKKSRIDSEPTSGTTRVSLRRASISRISTSQAVSPGANPWSIDQLRLARFLKAGIFPNANLGDALRLCAVTEPMLVTGFAANFSPMPRMAPPTLGNEIDGTATGSPWPFRLGRSSVRPDAFLFIASRPSALRRPLTIWHCSTGLLHFSVSNCQRYSPLGPSNVALGMEVMQGEYRMISSCAGCRSCWAHWEIKKGNYLGTDRPFLPGHFGH